MTQRNGAFPDCRDNANRNLKQRTGGCIGASRAEVIALQANPNRQPAAQRGGKLRPGNQGGQVILMKALAAIAGIFLAADAAGAEMEPGVEVVPPQVIGFGDTRPCYMKLSEPSLDGQQVGDLEVLAVVTIGADGKIVSVEVPALATMQIRSWAKNRIQRWASCVVKAMRFESGTQDGAPIETSVGIPLKSWTEVGPHLLEQRESKQAERRFEP
jgi:hypothetical protein